MQSLWDLDRELFRLIHLGWKSPFMDPIMAVISMTGVGHVHLAPLLVGWLRDSRPTRSQWSGWPWLLGLLLIPIVFVAGEADKAGWIQVLGLAVIGGLLLPLDGKIAKRAIVSFLVSGAVHVLIKAFMERERPSNFSWAVPMENVYSSPAYPSGHTSTAFAIGLVLFLSSASKPVRYIALAWGVLVGISRIYVGVHWPTDVIGGFGAGAIGAASAMLLGSYWETRKTRSESQGDTPDGVELPSR